MEIGVFKRPFRTSKKHNFFDFCVHLWYIGEYFISVYHYVPHTSSTNLRSAIELKTL